MARKKGADKADIYGGFAEIIDENNNVVENWKPDENVASDFVVTDEYIASASDDEVVVASEPKISDNEVVINEPETVQLDLMAILEDYNVHNDQEMVCIEDEQAKKASEKQNNNSNSKRNDKEKANRKRSSTKNEVKRKDDRNKEKSTHDKEKVNEKSSRIKEKGYENSSHDKENGNRKSCRDKEKANKNSTDSKEKEKEISTHKKEKGKEKNTIDKDKEGGKTSVDKTNRETYTTGVINLTIVSSDETDDESEESYIADEEINNAEKIEGVKKVDGGEKIDETANLNNSKACEPNLFDIWAEELEQERILRKEKRRARRLKEAGKIIHLLHTNQKICSDAEEDNVDLLTVCFKKRLQKFTFGRFLNMVRKKNGVVHVTADDFIPKDAPPYQKKRFTRKFNTQLDYFTTLTKNTPQQTQTTATLTKSTLQQTQTTTTTSKPQNLPKCSKPKPAPKLLPCRQMTGHLESILRMHNTSFFVERVRSSKSIANYVNEQDRGIMMLDNVRLLVAVYERLATTHTSLELIPPFFSSQVGKHDLAKYLSCSGTSRIEKLNLALSCLNILELAGLPKSTVAPSFLSALKLFANVKKETKLYQRINQLENPLPKVTHKYSTRASSKTTNKNDEPPDGKTKILSAEHDPEDSATWSIDSIANHLDVLSNLKNKNQLFKNTILKDKHVETYLTRTDVEIPISLLIRLKTLYERISRMNCLRHLLRPFLISSIVKQSLSLHLCEKAATTCKKKQTRVATSYVNIFKASGCSVEETGLDIVKRYADTTLNIAIKVQLNEILSADVKPVETQTTQNTDTTTTAAEVNKKDNSSHCLTELDQHNQIKHTKPMRRDRGRKRKLTDVVPEDTERFKRFKESEDGMRKNGSNRQNEMSSASMPVSSTSTFSAHDSLQSRLQYIRELDHHNPIKQHQPKTKNKNENEISSASTPVSSTSTFSAHDSLQSRLQYIRELDRHNPIKQHQPKTKNKNESNIERRKETASKSQRKEATLVANSSVTTSVLSTLMVSFANSPRDSSSLPAQKQTTALEILEATPGQDYISEMIRQIRSSSTPYT